jgi:hypothetical protein
VVVACCSGSAWDTASWLMFAFRLVLERLLGGADSTGAASAIASDRNASASDALARERPARDVSAGTAVIGDDGSASCWADPPESASWSMLAF